MKHWIGMILFLVAAPAIAVPVSGQGTWETTLQARDVDNDGTTDAFYDTVLDVTWLADAGHGETSGFAWTANGTMNWNTTQQWLTHLNDTDYLGANVWRLPEAVDLGAAGCNNVNGTSPDFGGPGADCGANTDPAAGELAHLFFVTLGNQSFYDLDGNTRSFGDYGMANTGDFINWGTGTAGTYRYGTPSGYVRDETGQIIDVQRWGFMTATGQQGAGFSQSSSMGAIAVMDGDIANASVVPIPAAAWLFGSALAALGWRRRRS